MNVYKINKIPSYDIKKIVLYNYNNETRKTILSNFKNYTQLKIFDCNYCNLTELQLPDLPDLLTHLDCENNKLIELPYLPHTLIELNCSNSPA